MIGLGLGAATSAILDSGGNFQDTKAMSFDGATDQVASVNAWRNPLFTGSGVSISLWAKDDAFHNTTKLFVNRMRTLRIIGE